MQPPLVPGCLIVWQDYADRFHMALVLHIEAHDAGHPPPDFKPNALYVVTYVHDQRLKMVWLTQADHGTRWRVLHGTS